MLDVQVEVKVLLANKLLCLLHDELFRHKLIPFLSVCVARRVTNADGTDALTVSIDRIDLSLFQHVVEHKTEWLKLEEALTDEDGVWWVPETVFFSASLGNLASFNQLFKQLSDHKESVLEFVNSPFVVVVLLIVRYSDEDFSFT